MEVVAHQGANGAVILPRDFRGPRENGGLVRGEPDRLLDGYDHLLHLGYLAGRKEYRHVREQVSLRADEPFAEFRIASFLL